MERKQKEQLEERRGGGRGVRGAQGEVER